MGEKVIFINLNPNASVCYSQPVHCGASEGIYQKVYEQSTNK